mmetsp:Transcript_43924/g.73152  ORF Transcript_43924/g.73152 Transcript_43924/m.73152 type:complete len:260 (+) Transcript_43924:927-1706(+)
MRIGAWPASASLDKPKRLNTFIDESVLKKWDLTTKHSPETSLQGFLRTVEAEGEDWGCGAEHEVQHKIGEAAFRRAYNEWAHMQATLKEDLGLLHRHDCPCCSDADGFRSIHCDGNHKLFTFDRGLEPWRQPLPYRKPLFYGDAPMASYLEAVDIVTNCDRKKVKHDTHCGAGHWKGAKDSKEHKAKRDVTGRVFAVCGHGIPIKAANMIKMGERWGFAHKLFSEEFRLTGVAVLYIDIMCKWAKWYVKARRMCVFRVY